MRRVIVLALIIVVLSACVAVSLLNKGSLWGVVLCSEGYFMGGSLGNGSLRVLVNLLAEKQSLGRKRLVELKPVKKRLQ